MHSMDEAQSAMTLFMIIILIMSVRYLSNLLSVAVKIISLEFSIGNIANIYAELLEKLIFV